MNQAYTTYQSDYSARGWYENNFISNVEFCTKDNINDCLKFISEEFSVLGYPSIYSSNSECFLEINCDIVNLLNAVFDLLKHCNERSQNKENLEDRNQRLSSDLIVLQRKNSQLKAALEQQDRKVSIVLERERQLKEKNEQLMQLLKTEKEETRRLTVQISKEKLAYQHDLRKYENNQNHIKNKLNQLLSGKTSNKKIATMNMSQPLPKSPGQRGKWKTTSSASSAAEEMYNNLISNFENRTKESYRQVLLYQQYLQSVLLQMVDVITLMQTNEEAAQGQSFSEEFALSFLNNECRSLKSFDKKFTDLFAILKKNVQVHLSGKNNDLDKEAASTTAKITEFENFVENSSESQKVTDLSTVVSETEKESCAANTTDKEKLEDKSSLCIKSRENLKKLLTEMSAQKLAALRLKMHEAKNPTCQSLSTLPSMAVITSQDGTRKLTCSNTLKMSSSSPDTFTQSPQFWKSEKSSKDLTSKSETFLIQNRTSSQLLGSTSSLPSFETNDIGFPSSNLPSWAMNETNTLEIENKFNESFQNFTTDEFELTSSEPSSEENFLRLQAAMIDIEKRKVGMS